MLLAAQARGLRLPTSNSAICWLRDGVAFGRMRALTVRPDPAGGSPGGAGYRTLSALECILMRKDPPFDTEYIYSTYILERAESQGVLVVNRPRGLRGHEREGLHGLVPAVLRDRPDHARHGGDGRLPGEHGQNRLQAPGRHGWRSIFGSARAISTHALVFETLTDYGQRFALAQRYIPDHRGIGDSRVLLIEANRSSTRWRASRAQGSSRHLPRVPAGSAGR